MKRTIWHLEVPKHLNKLLENYLKTPNCVFSSKSEFIREAVRELLAYYIK